MGFLFRTHAPTRAHFSPRAPGSLASETLPNGAVLAYAYDEEGNQVFVTASTESGEGNTNITHYTAGLVTRVESGTGKRKSRLLSN